MGKERFYLNAPLEPQTEVHLSETEHHHLAHVMRCEVGDEVELVNGKGSLATARTLALGKRSTTLKILSVAHHPPFSPAIALAIPLMRPSKLEWVIEKATELGADTFHLYTADQSEKDSLSTAAFERLRALTLSALKQSDRLYLPTFELHPRLDSLLSGHALFGDPTSTTPLTAVKEPTIFFSGPEKGFSSRELTLLRAKARGVRLNPNTLRAETAPIAAIAILRN